MTKWRSKKFSLIDRLNFISQSGRTTTAIIKNMFEIEKLSKLFKLKFKAVETHLNLSRTIF
jgi:hypothetical protein